MIGSVFLIKYIVVDKKNIHTIINKKLYTSKLVQNNIQLKFKLKILTLLFTQPDIFEKYVKLMN